MKIGIDIDNVIANTFQDLIPHYNRFMKRQESPMEVIETMRREKFKMLRYYFRAWRTRIMTSISIMDGAANTIRQWHRQQHKIKLITSRLFLFNRQTKWWLKKHDIPFHELHHAKEKTKFQKGRDCQVFIEDNLEECEVLANHCEKVFLIDHPWNQRPTRQNNIIRVKNWKELQELI